MPKDHHSSNRQRLTLPFGRTPHSASVATRLPPALSRGDLRKIVADMLG